MKITTFNPMVVTDAADETVSLFETLGFERRHAPMMDDQTEAEQDVRLVHEAGFSVDVASQPGIGRDLTMIRMNVDDFDEAYETLIRHGFKNIRPADGKVKSEHSVSATLVGPSGMMIAVVKHLK